MTTDMTTDTHTSHLFEAPAAGGRRVLFIRDLADGQAVDAIFMVRERSLRKKRNGDEYMRLTLADASGTLPAVCWEVAGDLHEVAGPGLAVRVCGRFEVSQRFGPQLTVQSIERAADGAYDPADLADGPALDPGRMEADLRSLVETVHDPHLRLLLDALYGQESEVWHRFRAAPAAKYYHQAYKHGLLEHTLSVGQAVSTVSAAFPGIDRDLAVTGALIHDIGKIEAYGMDPAAIDLTDDGKLQGEIPLGYYIVRSTIERLEGFPPELERALLHIVLSHHGALENGSPVVPATREATIVHMIDNLGGRLGSFDRLEKGLQQGESWSTYDRALEGSAYFGPAQNGAAPAAAEALPAASGE
jgi:3'-5' exoribonuclease